MITLKDRLSHLSYRQACRYLGDDGERLIRQGGRFEIDVTEQVSMNNDVFRLDLGSATVEIALHPDRTDKLFFQCSACRMACEHLGAAFSRSRRGHP